GSWIADRRRISISEGSEGHVRSWEGGNVESHSQTVIADVVIETNQLHRAFGEFFAVDGIDLRVDRGQFYGFLGPNGAGKSTTIKMLTGLLRPTSGSIRILGLDLYEQRVEVKRRIGVVPEGLALFERLTGTQLLNFI